MAAGVAISRITGLLREQTFAYLFGASASTEAFVAAFRIPNFFRDLLAENVASAAVVPSYVALREKEGRAAAGRFAAAALSLVIAVSLVIVSVGILAAVPLCSLIAPGFVEDPVRFGLMVTLTRWLFPFLTLIGVAALFQAVQNAEGKFFLPAISTAGLNIALIIGGWLFTYVANPPIVGMAWGVLLGGLTAVFMLIPGYRRAAGGLRLGDFRREPQIRTMLALAAPVVVGVAATNINVLVNTLIATMTGEPGALAWLNYGYRVMHLPLGLIAVSLGTAALPMLARAHQAGDASHYRTTLGKALGYALLLSSPVALGCVILRYDIITVLFHYGRFTANDVHHTGLALAAYAVGIPAFAWNRILAPAFYARHESRIPVQVGILSVVINIVLNIAALMSGLGYLGISLSASVAGYVQTAVLLLVLRRRLGGIGGRRLVVAAGQTAISMVGMTLVIGACSFLPPMLAIARVSIEIVAAGGVYLVAIWILRGRHLRMD